jgi:hypothetical protein
MSTYVELAKLGAIGVSVICLLLSFRWSSQVTALAKELTPERLRTLTTHARWTMCFAMGFLIVALASEIISHAPSLTDIGVELVPSDLADKTKQLKILKSFSEPLRVKLAGATDAIQFTRGTGHVMVSPGTTVSVDVNDMITAIETEEAIARGEELVRKGNGGNVRLQP